MPVIRVSKMGKCIQKLREERGWSTKMFQFPAFALCHCIVTVLQTAGLSHSEILGSMVICTYPRLIAAYHVLHRLREPRHPPCALFYFLRISILIEIRTETVAHTFSCCY